jgi:Ribonuclease G/E
MTESNNGQAQTSIRTFHTVNDVDWPGLRAAAVAIGIRKAARQAARDLLPAEQERFVQRAMKRCSREKWLVKAQQDKADAVKISTRNLSANVRSGAAALVQTLAERRQESIVHLSKYTVDAGKRLANSRGELKNARAFQQITSGRAHLFPEAQPQTRVQVNVLNYAAIKPLRSEDQDSAKSG